MAAIQLLAPTVFADVRYSIHQLFPYINHTAYISRGHPSALASPTASDVFMYTRLETLRTSKVWSPPHVDPHTYMHMIRPQTAHGPRVGAAGLSLMSV